MIGKNVMMPMMKLIVANLTANKNKENCKFSLQQNKILNAIHPKTTIFSITPIENSHQQTLPTIPINTKKH